MPVGPNEECLVEVWCESTHFEGTGYLLTPDLVLTACHVIVEGKELPADIVVEVRTIREWKRGGPYRRAQIVWPGTEGWSEYSKFDIALLQIREQGDDPGGTFTPAELGIGDDFPTDRRLGVTAAGFPRFKEKEADGDAHQTSRDTYQMFGKISLLDSVKEGALEIEHDGRSPRDEASWKGISGAAIFAENRIIGVLVLRVREGGMCDFKATRLDSVLALPGFQAILNTLRKSITQISKIVSKTDGNRYFQSVTELLSGLDLVESIYLPHYQRTVTDLGEPGLSNARGLIEIVKELSSLRDGRLTNGVPYGLLQFLLRLARIPTLKVPINDWIQINAGAQINPLCEINRKIDLENKQKILIIVTNINDDGKMKSIKPYIADNDYVLIKGKTFPEMFISGYEDFQKKIQELLTHFKIDGELSNIEIHVATDPPYFDWPFHLIPVAPGERTTIGEQVVVVVRDRRRLFCRDWRLTHKWKEYAAELRRIQPKDLNWLRIDTTAELPKEKGLCFARFVLSPVWADSAAVSDLEKNIMSRLLRLGAPYLYWPHFAPTEDGWQVIEKNLAELVVKLPNLDEFPTKFADERIRGSGVALQASILWDDPEKNPFTKNTGVRLE
jgi:hypothetical protein